MESEMVDMEMMVLNPRIQMAEDQCLLWVFHDLELQDKNLIGGM